MLKVEEYLEREEFEVSLRLKAILDQKAPDFARIGRLDLLYQKFCSTFTENIKRRVDRSISKHIRLLSHKLHELILAFKTNDHWVELHKEISLFYEVSLLRKVQLVCEQGGVQDTFFSKLETQLNSIRKLIFSSLESTSLKSTSLEESLVEVFCFQYLIGGIREGLYPDKGGRLAGDTRLELARFSHQALVNGLTARMPSTSSRARCKWRCCAS